MNEMELQIQLPGFMPEHFVEPAASQWFHSRFFDWLNGWRKTEEAPKMILGLTGPYGVGKTWLLQYLEQMVEQFKSPQPFFFDLEDQKSISDISSIRSNIQFRFKSKGPVLLLDNVPPPPLREPLRNFEYGVLRPCAEVGACIVMALTAETRVCWHTTYLQAVELQPLGPFDNVQTQAQLEKLGSKLECTGVYNQSGGLPFLNYLINQYGVDQAFDLYLSYWLGRIPSSDREQIRQYLNITCLLDFIEDTKVDKVKKYLQSFRDAPAFEIRNALKKYGLTESIDGMGSLVLRKTIKKAAQKRLEKEAPSLYYSLMQANQK